MVDILLFGGTTEGRELSEALKRKNVPSMVCVATEYGESLLEPG
ncbi:MAG: precorrin-6A/cobalt-precorrin-6A reductase, partial [Oscillospiraceae bacterium]|nr:precorrin-6A/cobalt-precorrin-6A reductase [Oscillospiraceae bacterium]